MIQLLFLFILFQLNEDAMSHFNDSFISIEKMCPSIVIEASYATKANFTGEIVDGYKARRVFTTKAVAEALCLAQEEALSQGLSLKVFDGYRPQKAVLFFQKWAMKLDEDFSLKQKYYPTLTKKELFENGYIATRSSHSRGSAVDLTLVENNNLRELDMGSPFDYFDTISHTDSEKINELQKQNRKKLTELLDKYGFKNYHKEWWHFSLKEEPFPDTYFDFDII